MGVRRRGGRGFSAPTPGPVPGAEAEPAPVLDPATAAYFRRALETLQEGLSPEELELFGANVLAEAAGTAPAAARDPTASQLLRLLLPGAGAEVLSRVLSALTPGGLAGAAGHPLGSRVLEAALAGASAALARPPEPSEEPPGQLTPPGGQLEAAVGQLEAAVGQLAAAVGRDLVAFARHPAGSFVVRALLRVLAGDSGAGHEDQPMKMMVKRMRRLVNTDGGHQVTEATHEDVGQWIMRECL
ncbi:nucleolar protein 9 [Apteryx mantelli]|uniref:Nucleolar protein 9 n=1 Tax=Apteryx mantelli TaxID=2696672 RepID=A0ABM4G1H8_9AVES